MTAVHKRSTCLAVAFLAWAALPLSAELSPAHQTWLEDVALLMAPQEREAFLALSRDYQRAAFIRRFWEVRDPFKQTAVNELELRWTERVRLARERFGNLTEDRARMLLLNGEPAHVLRSRCSELVMPLEVWSYPGSDRIKGDFSLTFVSPGTLSGPWRLWSPAEGIASLLAFELQRRIGSLGEGFAAISEGCPQGDELASRIAESLDWPRVEAKLKLLPDPGVEWLSSFTAYSTDVPEGASSFPAEIDLTFPGRFGSRTVVQGVVSVPRTEVRPQELRPGAAPAYTFLIDGEVLYKESLFEHFRYRFVLPAAEVKSDQIPVVFQRYLRPGVYKLIVKIEDTAGKSYFRDERELQVPAVEAAPAETVAAEQTPGAAPAEATAAAPTPQAALAEANSALGSEDRTIRILPPPPVLLTGRARVEAAVTGEGVSRVTFELNGKPILTKTRPPFSVEFNLGTAPRVHTVRALALDASGAQVAEDEVLLNAGPHRFAVRLVEPQAGKRYRSSLRAQAEVEIPEGEILDRVEVFLNDTPVATLYQPPFSQPILLPEGIEVTYVRAVAYLKDGNSSEDLVLINQADFSERLKVQLVELFTTVLDNRGRPVEGLSQEDFKVFEDGVAQEVRRFELVRDVPFYAGVLLDTSASMGDSGGEKLEAAVAGALQFFDTILTPRDRAAVITFADQPTLAVRFTNDSEILAGGLAGATALGNTALYDSLLFTLHYFGGIRGKRAVILLSDGKDEGSRYGFAEALEYARRSGVSLYTVGIGLSTRDSDARLKLSQLAEETGGRSFFIDRAGELTGVYKSVETEIRSQYLLAYQSTNSGDDEKYRAVEVRMARPGLQAKTLRGYFP